MKVSIFVCTVSGNKHLWVILVAVPESCDVGLLKPIRVIIQPVQRGDLGVHLATLKL